jgi:aminopeptidase N
MNEDRFTNMLRDFYGSFAGARASTEDFQKVVAKHAGIDMDWFFKQWVYGAEIPEYRFSYKLEQTPEDKYLAHCKIEQREVPGDFQMAVPVLVDFGKQGLARVRLLAKGPVTKVDLPLLPMKPDKIVFNDLESVLCEVEHVKWEAKER